MCKMTFRQVSRAWSSARHLKKDGNKDNGGQPNGSLRERTSTPSSEHKAIDKDTLFKLRNCSLAEYRPPESTKELRGELSGDVIMDPSDRGLAPHRKPKI
jgi:hypothetical protein